jgi:hypothetical protein
MNTKPQHSACGALLMLASIPLIALSGCDADPEVHLVSAPPPPAPLVAQTVTTATSPPALAVTTLPNYGTAVVVTQAPPALQPENPPERPSSDYSWIGGYWTWRDNHYNWTPGHWEIPPRAGAVWEPPRWEPEGSAYRFYNGHWD